MESLHSNKPQRIPNTRLSGFTLNTCWKSGELLLITGRSFLKACSRTTHKQDQGWEKDVRSRAGPLGGSAGIEPAALTLSS